MSPRLVQDSSSGPDPIGAVVTARTTVLASSPDSCFEATSCPGDVLRSYWHSVTRPVGVPPGAVAATVSVLRVGQPFGSVPVSGRTEATI